MSRIAALDRVAVALDTPDWETFREWAAFFGPRVGVLKLGLEGFVRFGERAVAEARRSAGKLFLDLKLHDIPATVSGALRAAQSLGADFVTVHASGGRAMLEAAVDASQGGVAVLAVTVLTHLDADALLDLDWPGDARARVLRWARLARDAGAAGVVCSPLELSAIRRELPPPFSLVTPGIRGAGAAADDQRRTASAGEAIRSGADFLVVGRPLTRATDREAALAALAAEITAAGRST